MPTRTLTCALAAFCLGATSAACGTAELHKGGPLKDSTVSLESMSIDVGKRGTYGIVDLENPTSKAVVLDRLKLAALTPHFRVYGPYVMKAGDCLRRPGCTQVGLIRRWPPPHTKGLLHVPKGFPVGRHRKGQVKNNVEVVIGFKALRKGTFGFRAIDVYYHVGNKRYITRYRDGLKICVPRTAPCDI